MIVTLPYFHASVLIDMVLKGDILGSLSIVAKLKNMSEVLEPKNDILAARIELQSGVDASDFEKEKQAEAARYFPNNPRAQQLCIRGDLSHYKAFLSNGN